MGMRWKRNLAEDFVPRQPDQSHFVAQTRLILKAHGIEPKDNVDLAEDIFLFAHNSYVEGYNDAMSDIEKHINGKLY